MRFFFTVEVLSATTRAVLRLGLCLIVAETSHGWSVVGHNEFLVVV